MRRFNFNGEISGIEYLNDLIGRFKTQADNYIEKLKIAFIKYKLNVSEINNNSFEFSFWGLSFITKTEILFDKESNTFKTGELNTYLVIDETLELIITYNFDYIGNIGNGCLQDDFADFYYVDFVNSLIKYTSENEIKFQLY